MWWLGHFQLTLSIYITSNVFRITPRIYGSIIFNILLFIASLSFTEVNTDPWQDGFYYLTLAMALLFNINDSIFQGAFASLIGRFPERYMNSLAQGILVN